MQKAQSSSSSARDASHVGPRLWGDEDEVVATAMGYAWRRIMQAPDQVASARPAKDLAVAAGTAITPLGMGGSAALRLFDQVLAPATRAQNGPTNLAYVPAAPTRAALAFEAVTGAANIFAGTWESGAGAIHAENEALNWLTQLIGWPGTAAGCFVSGGTMGNLSALITARAAAQASRGRPADGWKIVCADSAHSSIGSAARAMDVEIVTAPVDRRGHLTGSAVNAVLESTPGVFAVVATAGTTNAGLIDDLDAVADACARHHVWLHVDGAYGGAGLAAPSVRHLYTGIERADSFIVDPHKWLFAPYDCCALLYRDPASARAAHSQSAHYLDAIDRDAHNPADLALHLSRRARGLPFWFSLAVHGTDRYAHAVERTLTTSRLVTDAIRRSDHLRLTIEPELSVVLFERPGWSPRDYADWSARAAEAGTILCVPTQWNGSTVLRLAFVNPDTDADDVIRTLETLR
ncbi:pyridoxal phosphate-dependent decarboxylase family protein [Streptomyces stelliscabiei]|uniref:Glutamate/tyrosine decarboxylase-like PLP-dependent enzyme n=1 Tax=Streptomyces stelliscabiei TaxID=146820 RepID=A0A8I0NZK0_9ACTN|nr:aminotransferase class V-fold PLP-dependent enzyme [Streptomyces stelliscabiei]KND40529.1 glutamate decarboxylase [Streptomyces stelliscabiei]MBE1594612.1 glutamate/tyrosine decarboxylase-like PLP-dependent enzyme [Streptomyces stelliscabiei]MDX2521089.1 aminotransferase class V-fold PLP-dependent enzyme [Streptomyces stelliscabiei]MDX2550756.1 aminotransferase class V-fold PLP-dependent enzyme [Streptomyces stelliscabiei]MDX2616861.1 aminotransferase class V-fold PLP-dependent enzyme [Stre